MTTGNRRLSPPPSPRAPGSGLELRHPVRAVADGPAPPRPRLLRPDRLDGGEGFGATLTPALALKGDLPDAPIAIRHTTVTSCGPIPFLDALSGREGEWFVTYVRRLPSGLSVDATVPVAALVDEDALRAWRKADPS